MATNKNMKTPVYRRIKDICVDMYTLDTHIERRTLNGKVFLNSVKGEMTFTQNSPRGARSVEIGRTAHSRYVRRPDGDYTVTFHINACEKKLRERLLAEVRSLVAVIQADNEARMMQGDDDEEEWR